MQEQLKQIGFTENDFEIIIIGLTGTSGEDIMSDIKARAEVIKEFETKTTDEFLTIGDGKISPLIGILKDTPFGKKMIDEVKADFINGIKEELKEMQDLAENSALLRAKIINFRRLLIENKIL